MSEKIPTKIKDILEDKAQQLCYELLDGENLHLMEWEMDTLNEIQTFLGKKTFTMSDFKRFRKKLREDPAEVILDG